MNEVVWHPRGDGARWLICLAVVVLLHAGAGLYLLSRPARAPEVVLPTIMIDLEPLPAPAPADTPAEPEPEPAQQVDLPLPEPPPEPVLEQPPPLPVPLEIPPPEPPPELVLEPPQVPVTPAVPLPPKPPPKRPPPPKQAAQRPVEEAPVVPAPQAPRPAAASTSPAAASNWQSRLMGHLRRHLEYPYNARLRRQQGIAYVRFTMSPEGRVLSSRLERGSGFVVLDEAAMELMRRAQPLPPLPPEMPQQPIEITVPLRYELN